MTHKLKEVEQELQGGYISIFLIRYVLKAKGDRPGALQRGYMSIFLIRYALLSQGSRPGAPERMYEYIPH